VRIVLVTGGTLIGVVDELVLALSTDVEGNVAGVTVVASVFGTKMGTCDGI